MASTSKMQGTSAYIEKYYGDYKNVSCNMCVHANLDDRSCNKKPYVLRAMEDGVGNWKTCEFFDLKSEYNTGVNRKKVEKVKGADYFEQLHNKEKRLVNSKDSVKDIDNNEKNKKKNNKKKKDEEQEKEYQITVDPKYWNNLLAFDSNFILICLDKNLPYAQILKEVNEMVIEDRLMNMKGNIISEASKGLVYYSILADKVGYSLDGVINLDINYRNRIIKDILNNMKDNCFKDQEDLEEGKENIRLVHYFSDEYNVYGNCKIDEIYKSINDGIYLSKTRKMISKVNKNNGQTTIELIPQKGFEYELEICISMDISKSFKYLNNTMNVTISDDEQLLAKYFKEIYKKSI